MRVIKVTDPLHPIYKFRLQTWVTNGATVAPFKIQVIESGLIAALVYANLWSKIDVLQIYSLENTGLIPYQFKGAASPTFAGTPTFTARQGYTTNGSSNYINTNISFGTVGYNFVRDDASFFCWRYANAPSIFGCADGFPDRLNIIQCSSTGFADWGCNATAINSVTTTMAAGLAMAQRVSSTSQKIWLNGTLIDTQTNTSADPTTRSPLIGAFNASAGVTFPIATGTQLGMIGIGGSMTGREAELSAIFSRYYTLLAAA